MKHARKLFLYGFLVILSLNACKKNDNDFPPVGEEETGSLNINLEYPQTDHNLTQFELIISEPGGKVLLDTLAPVATPIVASLKTKASLVDVTTIAKTLTSANISINTYKGVDPSGWSRFQPTISYLTTNLSGTPINGSTYYTNVPASPRLQYYACGYGNGIGILDNHTAPSSFTATYSRVPGNYAYLGLLSSGLYKFHIPQAANDTVDLSQMDTTLKLRVDVPLPYQVYGKYLYAVLDTTDFSKSLLVYPFVSLDTATVNNLQYPGKNVQKFELSATYEDQNSSHITLYTYDSVVSAPSSFPFPKATDYTINSTGNNAFSVSFLKDKPALYNILLTGTNLSWTLYSSSDSTSLQPAEWLQSLGSKILQGQDLSTLKISQFNAEYFHGVSYASYWEYVFDPVRFARKELSFSLRYLRTF